MSQPLRVDDFVDELKKYDRKEDFMAVMKQYEQRYYDQFEQYANNNYPPELQRQQIPKPEQLWKQQQQQQQQQQQRPPIIRSSSANKLDYQDQFSIFPQAPQFGQRPPSRGEIQDPFKRPQENYDYRMSPVNQQDPFRSINKQQFPTQQRNQNIPQLIQGPQILQNQNIMIPQQQIIGQQPIQNQIPIQYQNQVNIPINPPSLFGNINQPQQQQQQQQQQQFYEQTQLQQQQYQQYQKTMPNQQTSMDAFLNEIKSQRMQKQQQYK